jgi:hypothetical protein
LQKILPQREQTGKTHRQTFLNVQNKRSEDVNKVGIGLILILGEEEKGQEGKKTSSFI